MHGINEQQLAVPVDLAAKIARLSRRQVDYWAKTSLVVPSVDRRLSPGRRIRLYGFVDLLALSVGAELKTRGVSLQHIRKIVRYLKTRKYERPLTEVRYATIGKRVYFQHEDGTWEGDLHPDQIVLHQVLNLEPIRQRIAKSVSRDQSLAGTFERRRGALGSKPVLAGTRIPVETVRRYLDAGRTTDEILTAYPDLTRSDVDAVRYEAAV